MGNNISTSKTKKNIVFINELFSHDFFEKLKYFIFDEDFDNFYTRRISEYRDYVGYDEQIWHPIEDDMKTSDIYPLSFDDFLYMYENIGCCTYYIDESLFCIKFFIKELFSGTESELLNNENFSIKINNNIVINQYEKVFNSKFLEIKLSKLPSQLGIIIKNKKSLDLYARELICYPFEFIKSYIQMIADKLLIDNELLINSYSNEVKYKFLSDTKNKTKDENYWAHNLKELCKNERNLRFSGKSGIPEIEIVGSFPRNPEMLKKEIKRIKDEYDSYPEIKKELRKIKKGVDVETVRDNIYSCLTIKDQNTTYITLDGEIKTVNEYGRIDCSIELLATIENYIKLASQYRYQNPSGYICSISDVIRYTLLEESGDLKNFKSNNDILKVIRNYFDRKKEEKNFYIPLEQSKIYSLKKFREKYYQFFKK